MFRVTYEKQPESLYMLNEGEESIPPFLDTPCIMDVTREYTQTADVEAVLYDIGYESRYVYLAAFDNQNWSIVHWGVKDGKTARFTDMACNVIYLPVYYREGGLLVAGLPFLLDAEGHVKPVLADTTETKTVDIKRKYNDIRSNQFLQGVIGGKFQVANQEDFSDAVTIYTIPTLEDNKFHIVRPACGNAYRYFRYLSPDGSRGNMAELYTLNASGDTIRHKRWMGNFHVRPWRGPEMLFDGDVLSFYDSHDLYNVWYGWEMERPETIDRIIFLPRNDDNFIRDGETYELFYWNIEEWESLGRKIGNMEGVLTYDNAPQGALFRLHNHTKGVEERIFTIENGKQKWW